jgi:glycosyltransferase involved in cell wall biosynthesis
MPRPIRILLAINTLARGGAERQLVYLATGLDRERFDTSVVAVRAGGALQTDLAAGGVPVRVVDAARPVGFVALVRHIRELAPDVVHAFLFGSNVAATFAAAIARVPVVITSRRSLGFFKDGRPHYDLLQSIANRFTDVIVANADAIRDDTVRREGVDRSKVRVIPNGVDLDLFLQHGEAARARTLLGNASDSRPLVVVVANLISYKGLTYFVDAWREVLKAVPSARAMVVGEGPARQDLEARAHDMDGRLAFVGVRDDVPQILSEADLVVQSSLYEGLPNAMLEAMAAARPTVATAVGGTGELVVHEQTGLLVPAADSAALANAMLRLLRAPDLAAAYGRAGRARVESLFSVTRMVDAYADLYSSLASRSR